MDQLIALNSNGSFRVGNRGGYWINKKLTKGLHKFLKKDLKMRKKDMYARGSRNKSNYNVLSRAGKVDSSSMKKGRVVHQCLFHQFVCKNRAGCICKSRCGSITRRDVDPFSVEGTYVEAAKQFARDNYMVPKEGELIVACSDFPLATQVDSVMQSKMNGAFFVVSWKTGLCPAVNSPQYKLHQMQASIEWGMLERYHNVSIQGAIVVYLHCIQPKYNQPRRFAYTQVSIPRMTATKTWEDVRQKLDKKKKKKKPRASKKK